MLTRKWQKSSRSQGNGGNCVEARVSDETTVQVRDTKLGESSPIFSASHEDWTSLLRAAR